MAAQESPRTAKLYDRTGDEITLDEVERIIIQRGTKLVASRASLEEVAANAAVSTPRPTDGTGMSYVGCATSRQEHAAASDNIPRYTPADDPRKFQSARRKDKDNVLHR